MNSMNRRGRAVRATRVKAASAFAVEAMESRMFLSGTPIGGWNFNNTPVSTTPNIHPAASTAVTTAVATSVGFQPGNNFNGQGAGTYPYFNGAATGTADVSDILSAAGSSDTATTNNGWRLRGGNGWSQNAAIASQGAEFKVSTVGYDQIQLSFDWLLSGVTAEGQLAVQYTTDGSTWLPVTDPARFGVGANGTTTSVVSNTAATPDPKTIAGSYFKTTSAAFQNGLSVDFTGLTGVGSNPSFGVRLVNSSTGTSALAANGAPYTGTNNWRLDSINISGTAVSAPPAITTQPTNQTANVGHAATFAAAASNSPTSILWQESTDGGATFHAAPGTNNAATYTISAVAANQSLNQYEVTFTNGVGAVTSNAVTLTVPVSVPEITAQPTSQAGTPGGSISFSATALGNPSPTVLWKESTDSGATFHTAPGTNNATTYTISGLGAGQNNNQYEAVFTNSQGSATTTAATLTVSLTAPSITTQPAATTSAIAGTPVTLTAASSGNPAPTVAWFKQGSSTVLATTPSYTFTPQGLADSGNYYAVFTNSVSSVQTNNASVTVTVAPPVITTQSVSQTVTVGTAGTVVFTAIATGTPTPTVQWQASPDGGSTFTNIVDNAVYSGSATTTLTVVPSLSSSGLQFRAVFTSSGAPTATTSNVATLTVIGTPITQWIFKAGVASGPNGQGPANTPPATSSVHPATDSATLIGFDNDFEISPTTGTAIHSFPTADIITSPGVLNSGFAPFTWRVRGGSGAYPTGGAGSPDGWSQDSPQYSTGAQFMVDTTNYTNLTMQFQWYTTGSGVRDLQEQYTLDGGTTWISTGLANGGSIVSNPGDYYGAVAGGTPSGVIVNFQNIAGAANNHDFGVRLVSAYDPLLPLVDDSDTPGPGPHTLHGQYAAGGLGAVNAQQVIDLGDTSSNGSFTLTYTPGTGPAVTTDPIAYSAPNTLASHTSLASAIAAALNAKLGAGSVTVAALFPTNINTRYVVTFSGGTYAHAGQADLALNATGLAAAANIRTWTIGAASGAATPLGYTGAGGNWRLANITFNGTNGSGTVGATAAPGVTVSPQSQAIALGQPVTFTAKAYSEVAQTVQWMYSTDGGTTFNAVNGANQDLVVGTTTNTGPVNNVLTSTYTFTPVSAQSSYVYEAVFTNSAGSGTSSGATLTVVVPAAPLITSQPASRSVVIGNANLNSTAVFSVTITGQPAPAIQWQEGVLNGGGGFTFTNISGATGTSYILLAPTAAQSGHQFRAVVSNSFNGGTTVTSNAATLTVLQDQSAFTKWDFTSHVIGYDNSPTPSQGTGTAIALGMDDHLNPNPAAVTFTAADITSTTGTTITSISQNLWRIRGGTSTTNGGSPNGWSSAAPQYTQGAEFDVSTVGYKNVFVTLSWYATTQGIRGLQEQYTLDGTTWVNLGAPLSATSNDYYGSDIVGATAKPLPVVVDLSGIAGANNNSRVGIRLVSAYDPNLGTVNDSTVGVTPPSWTQSTDPNAPNYLPEPHGQYATANTSTGITAYNNASGNWRFGDIQFRGQSLATASTTTLTGSPNPSTSGGNPVTLTATVTTGATGTVTFLDGTTTLGTGTLGTANNATTATLITSALTALGNHSITAVYSGDATYATSTSAILTETVNARPIWLAAGSAATYSTSTHILTVTGNATILSDPGLTDLPIIVADGTSAHLFIQPTASSKIFHLGGLTLTNGATAEVKSITGTNRTRVNHGLLVLGTLTGVTPALSVDTTSANKSKLDLQDNDLLVHKGSLAAVQALAAKGRNVAPGGIYDGTWNGNGLASTAAATADSLANAGYEQNVLAIVLNGDLFLGAKTQWSFGTGTTLETETLGVNDVLVKYTYNGDLNLEGAVSDNAVTVFNTFYDPSLTGQNEFAYGDLNGDGKVDDNDVTIFNTVYGNGVTGSGLAVL